MDPVAPHPHLTAQFDEDPAARRRFTISITARSIWVAALIVLAPLILIFVLVRAQGPVVLLVLAIIPGEAIRPLVARLKQYQVPGPAAVLLIYLTVLLIAGVLLWRYSG